MQEQNHVVVAAHRDPERARGLAIHVVVSDAHSDHKLYPSVPAYTRQSSRKKEKRGREMREIRRDAATFSGTPNGRADVRPASDFYGTTTPIQVPFLGLPSVLRRAVFSDHHNGDWTI